MDSMETSMMVLICLLTWFVCLFWIGEVVTLLVACHRCSFCYNIKIFDIQNINYIYFVNRICVLNRFYTIIIENWFHKLYYSVKKQLYENKQNIFNTLKLMYKYLTRLEKCMTSVLVT